MYHPWVRELSQSNTQSRSTSKIASRAAPNITVLAQDRGTYTLTQLTTGYQLSNNVVANSASILDSNILRLRFADTSLALDINGNAGKGYRLYQATFNRVPDQGGLGYWVNVLDNGVSLLQIANDFIHSAEFVSTYGDNLTDNDFIVKLYSNVLHRLPDQGGLAYWVNILKQGESRAAVLVSFSESNENKDAVLPSIKTGIAYTEPGIGYRPVANAGLAQSAMIGATITLDGSASSDANRDGLLFRWRVNTRPIGSIASLSSEAVVKPTFRPDLAGQYVFSLEVNDGKSASTNTAIVYVNISASNVPVIADSGLYKCANLTPATALYLYQSGHTYLDRDKDGLPCEANDVLIESATTPPPVIVTPGTTPTTSGGMCYVNGYYRRNGTYVSGYYRRC